MKIESEVINNRKKTFGASNQVSGGFLLIRYFLQMPKM